MDLWRNKNSIQSARPTSEGLEDMRKHLDVDFEKPGPDGDPTTAMIQARNISKLALKLIECGFVFN